MFLLEENHEIDTKPIIFNIDDSWASGKIKSPQNIKYVIHFHWEVWSYLHE